jgi:hypothetical protein
MRHVKRVGVALLLVLGVGDAVSALASAQPEFLHSGKEVPSTKTAFTVKSKTGMTLIELAETKYKISCTSSLSTGRIKGTTKVEGVTGRFKGCKAKVGSEEKQCEVSSIEPVGKKEEIVTKELKGRLGSVLSTEAETGVGLLLEPASGEVYVTIMGSTECLPTETSEVKGSLIGEIAPIKKEQKTGELLYKIKSESVQMIKKFTGESATHELELFGVKTPLESKDTIEFQEAIEVT